MIPKDNKEKMAMEGRIKNRIIFILLSIIAFALYKFSTYPHQLVVYTAPDVTKGFLQKPEEVPETAIYGFARTLWESLNYCKESCATEYKENLNRYRAFLTNQCYTDLNSRFDRQIDYMGSRARRLTPTENAVFDISRVKKITPELWYVVLEYTLDEDINGVTTRKQIMQYPLKVTFSHSPTQFNPWALSIDCYWQEPSVVKYDDLKDVK
ncbi:DUF2895 family protein [Suttonella ornithocola]|uniref:Integrating conjugative element protein, PFL_4703 family n=1 Tax=Suttonella ornithocola TaxID=279832 RepID=A0A380MWN4_9GAMM|nr:DUF2895 family protein [Suttonella ornithocola]SUO96672.1 integrating conjugative element protein, PFL_4703 family [Suttonella ornithocola]